MTSSGTRKHTWIAAATGIAATLVSIAIFWSFDSPWTLRGDNKAVMFPMNLEAFRIWSSGHVPEWSDGFWNGLPLLADPTSMSLYWPNLFAFLLTPEPHLRAYDLATALHSGILVSGTVTLLRVLGVGVPASLFGGILIFAAPMHVWYASSMITGYAPVAWWPWMFLAAEMLSRDVPTLRYYVLGWLALASCAIVYPEFALYGGVATSVWLLTRNTGLRLHTRVFRTMVLGLGGIALAAPQLVPTALLLPDTTRGAIGAVDGDAAVSLFQIDRLLYPGIAEKIPSFVGIATLGFGLAGFSSRRPRSMFLGVLALLAYLLAIATPLYDLVHSLPVFEIFRQPMKFKLLSEIAIALLAAIGLDLLLANKTDRALRRCVALFACMAIGENVAYLGQRIPTGTRLPGDTDAPFSELYAKMNSSRLVRLARARPRPPTTRISETVRLRNIPMIHEVPVASGGPNALLPERHKRILSALFSGQGPTRRELTHFGIVFHLSEHLRPNRWEENPCLKVASNHELLLVGTHSESCLYLNKDQPTRFEIAGRPVRAESLELMVDRLEQKLRGDRTVLTARRQEPLSLQAEENSTPTAIVVLHHEVDRDVQIVAPPIEVALRRRALGSVKISQYRPGDIELDVVTKKSSGFLIVRESLFEGWQAFVNGAAVPIYPAAGLFFAVPVPLGASEVALRFHSPGVREGVQVALGWIILVCLSELARRIIRDRRRHLAQ